VSGHRAASAHYHPHLRQVTRPGRNRKRSRRATSGDRSPVSWRNRFPHRCIDCLALLFAGCLLCAPVAHAQWSWHEPVSGINFAFPAPGSVLDASNLCYTAIRAAEQRYQLPQGLLLAISRVESGRPDPVTHKLEPWPWTIQALGQSLYFESKAPAVQWVKLQRARGVTSIDTGCMQVNLYYHPAAFESIDQAFDPSANADYAARFLLQLHTESGDWARATGLYHSQLADAAEEYRKRVVQVSKGLPVLRRSQLDELRDAWRATLPAHPFPPQQGPYTWALGGGPTIGKIPPLFVQNQQPGR
jgi:hypothetical protein